MRGRWRAGHKGERKGREGERRLEGGGKAIDQRDKRVSDESRSTVIRLSGETLGLMEHRGGRKEAAMVE